MEMKQFVSIRSELEMIIWNLKDNRDEMRKGFEHNLPIFSIDNSKKMFLVFR